jgi:hypothetical protein
VATAAADPPAANRPEVAEDAVDAAGDDVDERLVGMRDFYASIEAQFAQLLDDYVPAMPKRPTPTLPRELGNRPGGV